MSDQEIAQRRKAVHRDSALTVLVGPLKFIVPTLSYVFIYPLMISRNGLDVVGVWSLLMATGTFIGVVDVGFSQLLARETGSDMGSSSIREAHADYTASVRVYIALLVLLTAVFLILKDSFLPLFGGVYPAGALTVSIVLVLAGAVIQLIGRLDSAILSAYQDNYIVQMVTAVAPVFTYSFALAGALLYRPIEGLAIGTVLSGLFTLIVLRFRLSSSHGQWKAAKAAQPLDETRRRLGALVRRGLYLYGSSVGLFIRGPVFRFVVAAALGLQATAVLDIAMRLTQAVRDIIASGFNVLYPSFSYLHRNSDRESIIELMQVSLMVLLPLGGAALGLLAGLYHTINHAMFKGLLFLGAGSLLYATHTRNMEEYGGLIRKMPWTAFFFLVGAISISALPPSNGFVSEWLIFQSLFLSFQIPDLLMKMMLPIGAAMLALTGVLALVFPDLGIPFIWMAFPVGPQAPPIQ